jgi:competence protein ComGC
MKRHLLHGLGLLLLFTMPALAQEHYTEGPVWQVSLVRVKPTQMDAYLTSLQEKSKPFLDEAKREGSIMDYKWFMNQTKHDPQDWDMALAVQYKNFAALDGLTAKMEALRDKIFGTKQAAEQVGEKREEIREVVATMLLREVNLK